MKILKLNEEGRVYSVKNSKGLKFEVGNIVRDRVSSSIILITGFIGDGDGETIYAKGLTGLKEEKTPNIENLIHYKMDVEGCNCKTCTNYCMRTGVKLFK